MKFTRQDNSEKNDNLNVRFDQIHDFNMKDLL